MCILKGFKPNQHLLSLACLLFPVACHQSSADQQSSLQASEAFQIAKNEYLTQVSLDSNIQSLPPTIPQQAYHTPSIDSEKIEFWQRLTGLYALPNINRRSIDQEIRWLVQNPNYLQRVQLRAAPFFPYILEQITINHIPGEIALLPIIESAFQAHAHSPKQAVGIWQFIPATGKRYGLTQDWWYDGRMDIHASTQAALKYLKKLHKQFDNDWLLAIAAYNCGETKVSKLRKKNRLQNKKTDFWSLPLPRETRSYVPRLLAISRLFAHPEQYQIERLPVSETNPLRAVSTDMRMDLAIVAEMIDLPLHQLYKLNPGFKRWATSSAQHHTLLIPSDKAELFSAAVASRNQDELIQVITHQVTDNETLGYIAEQYSANTTEIVHYNNLPNSTIHTGKMLQIPIATRTLSSYREAIASAATLPKQNADKAGIRYTVQPKDTIWDIAKIFSVSMKALAEENGLRSKNMLYSGQTLIIPATESGDSLFHYTVQKGDSLSLIAIRFNVKIAHLRQWNASTMGKYLKPGQKLVVRLSDSVENT